MLRKMGYNPGKGLGKTQEGRVEPVSVEVKADRAGLGREAAVKEILQRKMTMLQRRITGQNDSSSLNDFRNRKKDEALQRLVHADLGKSQRMCKVLDEQKDITEPAEPWFWPKVQKEPEEEGEEAASEEDEEEADTLEPVEMLELVTSYLRRFHFYCTWCATTFEDEQDLASNCPGATRDDH